MNQKMKVTDKIEIKSRRKNQMNSKLEIRGDFEVQVRDKSTGKVLSSEKGTNLVVDSGLESVAELLGALDSQGAFDSIAIGEGTTVPAAGDTALETELLAIHRATATLIEQPTTLSVSWEKTFDSFTVSTAITEAGVFDQNTLGGTMLDRFTFTAKNVDSSTDLFVKITLTIAAV